MTHPRTLSNPEQLHLNRAGDRLSAERRPGSGAPVLIVPGVMADAITWRPVVESINLPNPVVTVNRRGRPPSGPLGADYSVDVEVADLADELAAINDYQPALTRYRQLAMPVTLILGELNDGKPPYGTAFGQFAAALPQARVVKLSGQGHLAHAAAPEQLGRAIADAVG